MKDCCSMAIFPKNSPGVTLLFSVVYCWDDKPETLIFFLWMETTFICPRGLWNFSWFFFKDYFLCDQKVAYSLHFLRVNEILVFFFQVFFLLGNLNFLLVLREAFFFIILFFCFILVDHFQFLLHNINLTLRNASSLSNYVRGRV